MDTIISRRRIAAGLLALCGAAGGGVAQADAVTDWNARLGAVAVQACISPAPNPFHESRLYAMAHLAIHDALNAIERRSTPYAYDAVAAGGASADAAVAAAAHTVVHHELPNLPWLFADCNAAAMQLSDTQYAEALAAIPNGSAKTDGIATGVAAANAIIAARANDGSDTTFADFGYPQGTQPGEWRFTAFIPFAAVPGWGNVKPFALRSADAYLPPPPYPVSCSTPRSQGFTGSCELYARDLEDVKNYGGASSSLRTPDETQIALFWIESSPLGWNRIARVVAPTFGHDLWQNARLFALMNMALADGYVASAHTKYHYAYWRPETAVQLADDDGNAHTAGDPTWMPLAPPTPPVPDYESAHSVAGGVAAEVLRRVLGVDQVRFETCSVTLPEPAERCGGTQEVRRQFSSFSQAAAENGRSRVLVGYHFQNAVTKGLGHGRKIGAEVAKRWLQPTG